MRLIPYVKGADGQYFLTDQQIYNVWEDMVAVGVHRWTFYDKSVTTPEQFLAYLQRPGLLPVFVEDEDILGFGWLSDVVGNHAQVHFCAIKPGRKLLRGTRMVLDYWWSFTNQEKGLFDVLAGMTPGNNTRATRFIEVLGFTRVGEIPNFIADKYENKYVPAVISYCERK